MHNEADVVEVFTNAPKAYDYSFATEVDAEFCRDRQGRAVRRLQVLARLVDHQCGRYSSGLFFAAQGLEALERVVGEVAPSQPAEVTFHQASTRYADGGTRDIWTARLLNPDALDTARRPDDARVHLTRSIATIAVEVEADGRTRTTYCIQGGAPGSRRYGTATDLDDAQARIRRWAARRWRTEVAR